MLAESTKRVRGNPKTWEPVRRQEAAETQKTAPTLHVAGPPRDTVEIQVPSIACTVSCGHISSPAGTVQRLLAKLHATAQGLQAELDDVPGHPPCGLPDAALGAWSELVAAAQEARPVQHQQHAQSPHAEVEAVWDQLQELAKRAAYLAAAQELARCNGEEADTVFINVPTPIIALELQEEVQQVLARPAPPRAHCCGEEAAPGPDQATLADIRAALRGAAKLSNFAAMNLGERGTQELLLPLLTCLADQSAKGPQVASGHAAGRVLGSPETTPWRELLAAVQAGPRPQPDTKLVASLQAQAPCEVWLLESSLRLCLAAWMAASTSGDAGLHTLAQWTLQLLALASKDSPASTVEVALAFLRALPPMAQGEPCSGPGELVTALHCTRQLELTMRKVGAMHDRGGEQPASKLSQAQEVPQVLTL